MPYLKRGFPNSPLGPKHTQTTLMPVAVHTVYSSGSPLPWSALMRPASGRKVRGAPDSPTLKLLLFSLLYWKVVLSQALPMTGQQHEHFYCAVLQASFSESASSLWLHHVQKDSMERNLKEKNIKNCFGLLNLHNIHLILKPVALTKQGTILLKRSL